MKRNIKKKLLVLFACFVFHYVDFAFEYVDFAWNCSFFSLIAFDNNNIVNLHHNESSVRVFVRNITSLVIKAWFVTKTLTRNRVMIGYDRY